MGDSGKKRKIETVIRERNTREDRIETKGVTPRRFICSLRIRKEMLRKKKNVSIVGVLDNMSLVG